MFSIGFTGTQKGMSDQQKLAVWDLLENYKKQGDVHAIHGDCIGADSQFDGACRALGITRAAWPCTIEHKRAFCDAEFVFDALPPLERNRIIVENCDILVATPKEFANMNRSGTWYTVRYANKLGVTFLIILPDGTKRNSL